MEKFCCLQSHSQSNRKGIEMQMKHKHVWDKRGTWGWSINPLWCCIICGLKKYLYTEEITGKE